MSSLDNIIIHLNCLIWECLLGNTEWWAYYTSCIQSVQCSMVFELWSLEWFRWLFNKHRDHRDWTIYMENQLEVENFLLGDGSRSCNKKMWKCTECGKGVEQCSWSNILVGDELVFEAIIRRENSICRIDADFFSQFVRFCYWSLD